MVRLDRDAFSSCAVGVTILERRPVPGTPGRRFDFYVGDEVEAQVWAYDGHYRCTCFDYHYLGMCKHRSEIQGMSFS